ncbi:MAG: hypothetical protein ACYYKD_06090 [Rhodospirillales bacterium]
MTTADKNADGPGGSGAPGGHDDGADDIDALTARAARGEEIILHRPGARDGAAGVFSLVMTAAAVWLLLTGGLAGGLTGGVGMGAVSGLFFAAFGAFKLRLWLTPRARQVRLTPGALEAPIGGALWRLPWPAVSNIHAVFHASVLPGRGGGQMIVFNINLDTVSAAAAAADEKATREALFGFALSSPGRRAGLHPHYGLAAEDMVKLLETYRAAALKDV